MSHRAAASTVAVTAFLLAVGVLRARELAGEGGRETDRTLYVRSGSLAARLYLSFDALASDLYWIRTIQHYGRERQSSRSGGRFQLLEPLVDLTTTLDPRFNIAYRFGAILIALDPPNGPGRPDRAIVILEKGLRANPDRWQYAHDIGYVHYWHTGRFDEAARWFTRAAAMPGAPRWLGPLAAVTLARGGDRQGARRLLTELATTSDGYIKRSAERGLAQLKALDDLDALQALVRSTAPARAPTRQRWPICGRLCHRAPLLTQRARPTPTTQHGASSISPRIHRCGRFPGHSSVDDRRYLGCHAPRAGRWQLPERLHNPGACRRVGRETGIEVPLVSHTDPMVRQHPPRQLPASEWPLPAVSDAHRCPLSRGRVTSAAAFALQAIAHLPDVALLGGAPVLTASLVILFWTDFETRRLPNALTIPGMVAGLVLSLFLPPGLVAACSAPHWAGESFCSSGGYGCGQGALRGWDLAT